MGHMKVVGQNRRATYDYEIIDTFDAGIMLLGHEVKSCRAGNVNLAGSYVSLVTGAPVLKGATIAKYQYASGLDDYETGRDRPLLLSAKELKKLQTQLLEKGVSLIPMKVLAGKHIKVVLGLGKGKKRYDKRQKKKEQDVTRKLQQGVDY